jgi:hypothetical protein
MQAARQVSPGTAFELTSRHTLTVEQVEALADAVGTWQE